MKKKICHLWHDLGSIHNIKHPLWFLDKWEVWGLTALWRTLNLPTRQGPCSSLSLSVPVTLKSTSIARPSSYCSLEVGPSIYPKSTPKFSLYYLSGQRSTSEMVNARDNGVYMTNIAHIISLTADNLVVECGGVGKLVNEITVPGKVRCLTSRYIFLCLRS